MGVNFQSLSVFIEKLGPPLGLSDHLFSQILLEIQSIFFIIRYESHYLSFHDLIILVETAQPSWHSAVDICTEFPLSNVDSFIESNEIGVIQRFSFSVDSSNDKSPFAFSFVSFHVVDFFLKLG